MSATRPERVGEVEQSAAASEFEGEIRSFVRRDVAWRKSRGENEPAAETAVSNVDLLIQRVSGASVDEIDRVVGELQKLRGTLTSEGERIRREITNYAGLSQSAMTSLKIIGESLARLNPDPQTAIAPPIQPAS